MLFFKEGIFFEKHQCLKQKVIKIKTVRLFFFFLVEDGDLL